MAERPPCQTVSAAGLLPQAEEYIAPCALFPSLRLIHEPSKSHMMCVDAHSEAHLAPIRVVLGTMPPLLGDIVRETLAAHGDVEVLADVDTPDEIRSAVRRTDAQVAVLGIAHGDQTILSDMLGELFADRPRLTVITLAKDGRHAHVHQLQPSSVAIADLSPQSLVETIRATSTMDVHPLIHPFSAD